MINFNQATFFTSAQTLSQCPENSIAEVAFVGRSNAGKSSALNRLTNNLKLAKTSKTPGRTQLINFFSIGEEHYLVDLPGYGFAKAPKQIREKWQKSLGEYLEKRKSLKGLVILMDIRHPLMEIDRQMVEWGEWNQLPIHILLTKADKLKRGAAISTLQKVKNSLKEMDKLPTLQIFSATKGTGTEELKQQITAWLS